MQPGQLFQDDGERRLFYTMLAQGDITLAMPLSSAGATDVHPVIQVNQIAKYYEVSQTIITMIPPVQRQSRNLTGYEPEKITRARCTMNAVGIEKAISKLILQPFDSVHPVRRAGERT